jgi:hypothetical protein
VRDVVIEHPGGVAQQRAVAGQQHPQPGVVGQRPELVKGPQVVTERTVGGDHRGAPAEDGIPGEQRPVRCQQQAQRVGGVPGGGHHAQLAAGHVEHRARGESLAAQAVRRVKRGDRRAGQLGEPCGTRGVVEVPVRQDDLGHVPVARAGRVEHAPQVLLVLRPRVDHDDGRGARLGQHPGVSTVERHG